MTANDMRSHIIKAYSGEAWRQKVLKMNDDQVLAIFRNLQRRKRIK